MVNYYYYGTTTGIIGKPKPDNFKIPIIMASAKRAAKRLAKRALLTNVYVYRNRANHTYRLIEMSGHAKAEPEIPWSNMWTTGMGEAFWGGGSCDLKLAKMYVIEKCCNGYRPRSCKHSSMRSNLDLIMLIVMQR